MSDQKPSVLITGANGFIGSRLCRRFLDEGFSVIAGVRKTADLSLLGSLPVYFRYGDVTNPDSLPEMVRSVDYIIHNAGVVKAKSRSTFFDVNEQGTANLMEAIIAHNPDVKRVTMISSVAVAGPSRPGQPVTESDPPNPVTVYGQSKKAGEEIALSYADRLNLVVVRPPAVYGPGDTEMLSLFVAAHWHIRGLIGNTRRRLNLVHVNDLCRGIYLATTSAVSSGSVYFIAERKSYQVREMMRLISDATGRWSAPLIIPGSLFKIIAGVSETLFRIAGATPMLTADKTRELLEWWEISTDRAKEDLNYESEISLQDGTEETYRWYVDQGWI